MRFKGCLLTRAESLELMDKVDTWCRKTATNYNRLVTAAGVNVSIRHHVRKKDRRLTRATATLLRKAMRENPGGIAWQDHKARVAGQRRELRAEISRQVRAEVIQMNVQRVDRTPCPRCGVRADVGCKHTRVLSANGYRG